MNKLISSPAFYIWAKLFCFSIWPFISFYSHNSSQLPNIGTLFSYFLILLSLLCLSLLSLKFLTKQHIRKLTDLAAIFLILFFQYSFIKQLALNYGISHKILWIFITFICLMATFFISQSEKLSQFLAIMSLFMCLTPIGNIIYSLVSTSNDLKSSSAIDSQPFNVKPNVYLIMLDGYARADVLKKIYSFKNDSFLTELKSLNFVTINKARSNYPLTYLSISSVLNMNYPLKEGRNVLSTRGPFLKVLQGKNSLVQMFKDNGYSSLHRGSKLWDASHCGVNVDHCLNNSPTFLSLNETGINFLKLTPLLGPIQNIHDRLSMKLLKKEAEKSGLRDIQNFVTEENLKRHGPFLLFAHTLPPHPPAMYSPDCKDFGSTPIGSLKTWKDKVSYVQQVKCVNQDLLNLTKHILLTDRSNPIIVLMSDHGSATLDQLEKKFDDWSSEDKFERYSIFSSILIKPACREMIYPDMSAVNTFRLITACLQGKKPDFLKDYSYFSAYENSPEYGKIKKVKFNEE